MNREAILRIAILFFSLLFFGLVSVISMVWWRKTIKCAMCLWILETISRVVSSRIIPPRTYPIQTPGLAIDSKLASWISRLQVFEYIIADPKENKQCLLEQSKPLTAIRHRRIAAHENRLLRLPPKKREYPPRPRLGYSGPFAPTAADLYMACGTFWEAHICGLPTCHWIWILHSCLSQTCSSMCVSREKRLSPRQRFDQHVWWKFTTWKRTRDITLCV